MELDSRVVGGNGDPLLPAVHADIVPVSLRNDSIAAQSSDAIIVTEFIRMEKQRVVPNRDIILALPADEEGGRSNGADWLM